MESKLVIITSHYPFEGEPFLKDEIEFSSHLFKTIYALPESFHNSKIIKNAQNVELIVVRNSRYEFAGILWALFEMLTPKAFRERSFAYHVLGYRKQKRKVNRSIFTYFYISYLLGKAIRKIEVNQYTVFYSYWMSSGAYFLSKYKRNHPNVTCICRTHGGDCYIDEFYQPFRREIAQGLDGIFPVSKAGYQSVEKLIFPHVNTQHAILRIAPLGVFVPRYDKLNPTDRNDCFEIVTCSNVIPLKRIDLVIDALCMIDDLHVNWIHFGGGELIDEMKQYSKDKLSSKNNITYRFCGNIPKNEILKYYGEHHIDLFINASDTEGIPVSIMEAMAYSIPVVARNVGGNSEIVDDDCGILLDNQITPDILASAILKISDMDVLEIAMKRKNCHLKILNNFSSDRNFNEFYNILLENMKEE